ncbi:MAG: MFS transporter [Candidatus Heimdallarchaeota archaeon]|nr:MFS transporter [Candidatus Heimdallarchaeota archaeon]
MPEIKSSNPVLALTVLIFGHFLNHFYAYVLAAAMLVIRLPSEMNLTPEQVGMLSMVQMLVFAVFSLAVGIIGDRWLKSKKVFIPIGVILMAVHLFIASFAPEGNNGVTLLIIASITVGIGASFYHPIAYAAIADLYENKKGLTMALNAGLGMIGTSIAPGLVVTFDRWVGWRTFFIIFGIVGLVLGVLMFFAMNKLIDYQFTVKEIKEQENKKSMTNSNRVSNWFRKEFVVILTFAVIICLLYSSFRSGIFKITSQWLSIIFVDLYSIPTFTAGWITVIILVIGGLTAIIGGVVSDKFTTSLTMMISTGGSALILLIIFLLGATIPSFWIISLYFVFIGFLYFSAAAGTKYVAENVPQGSRATGISLLFAVPSIIAAIFPWIFGIIFGRAGEIWGIGFLFILAVAAMITSVILLVRDIQLGKFRKETKVEHLQNY